MIGLFILIESGWAASGMDVGETFAPFAEAMAKAIKEKDSAFVLQHIQFPLPIIERGITLNSAASPGVASFYGLPKVWVVEKEAWNKVGDCGQADDIMGDQIYPNTPGWVCDLFYDGVLSLPTSHAANPADFSLLFASPGPEKTKFSLTNPRNNGGINMIFDYMGEWMLRRVERVRHYE